LCIRINQRVRGRIVGRQDQKGFRANAVADTAQASQDNIDKEEIVIAVTKSIGHAQDKAFAERDLIENAQTQPRRVTETPQENLSDADARGIANSVGEKETQSFADPHAGGIANAVSEKETQSFADALGNRNTNAFAKRDPGSTSNRKSSPNADAQEKRRACFNRRRPNRRIRRLFQ
jgi:hypothetical protein